MIGAALEWLAEALAGLTSMSRVRLLAVLALGLAALYARRVTSIGAVLGRSMTIVAVVMVVLATGIAVGVIDPNLSAASSIVVDILEALREVA